MVEKQCRNYPMMIHSLCVCVCLYKFLVTHTFPLLIFISRGFMSHFPSLLLVFFLSPLLLCSPLSLSSVSGMHWMSLSLPMQTQGWASSRGWIPLQIPGRQTTPHTLASTKPLARMALCSHCKNILNQTEAKRREEQGSSLTSLSTFNTVDCI